MEFNKPDKLSLIGNMPENFKQFKEDVENYFIATETMKKSNPVKVARLKNLMGKEALQLYNSLVTDVTDESIESIMDVLGNYCLPKKNEIMDVFKFVTCRQSEGESFDKFLANLRHRAKICDFKDQEPKERDPCLYVLRYANNLEFGDKTHEVTMTALRLVQRMKKDNIHYGRRPSGLCGAALLMAARLHDFNRTVGDIVKIVHIHESTLRKRLVEFGETPSSSLTLDEFMNVDLEEEQDPPSYKAARAKDRERAERLQKMIDDMETESSSSSQISQLQREIERKLEERRALKRPVLSEKNLSLTSSTDGGSVEEVDTDKFVTQSTLGVIHDCLTTEDAQKETTQPVGLGPTAALMGLESNKADSGTTEKQFGDESGELDLVGIDDDDIDQYIMSEHDANNKDKIWMAMNADYLREQKEKEERLEKEREEGKPEKKKRKVTGKKNKNTLAASSAGEAIEKMLQEKKISSKINYDVLKSLNVEGSINPTPTEPQKLPEPEIILPPPKSVLSSKRSKAVPKVQKVKAEVKTEPIKIKEQLKEEIVAPVPVIKTDQSATGESSEADPDLDMEEYEEEELETVEQTLSLSQMLNRHRADDNYYGYDDDDY